MKSRHRPRRPDPKKRARAKVLALVKKGHTLAAAAILAHVPRQVANDALAAAVDDADKKGVLEKRGKRDGPTRQEWAESRKAEGWDAQLVDLAIGGGALAEVRGYIRDTVTLPDGTHVFPKNDDGREPDEKAKTAMVALGKIDAQRELATRHDHGIPPHRRAYAPLRFRAE